MKYEFLVMKVPMAFALLHTSRQNANIFVNLRQTSSSYSSSLARAGISHPWVEPRRVRRAEVRDNGGERNFLPEIQR